MTALQAPRPMDMVRRVARSTLIIIGGSGLNFVVSLLRQRIVAQLFGTSSSYDAYVAADSVSELLVTALGLLTISYAFTPIYIEFLEKGDPEKSNRLVSQVINTFLLAAGVLAALAALLADTLVRAPWGLAPGFPSDVQTITIALLRILMLTVVIFVLSGLATGILHAHNHFWLPSLSPTFYSLGIIFGALVFVPHLGIYGLAWGAIVGASLHFLIQVPGLVHYKIRWSPILDTSDPALKRVMILIAPRVLDLMMARASITWLNNNLSSQLGEGRASALSIAYRVMNIPWTIIGTALGLAIFPLMAELAARKDLDAQRQALSGGLRGVLIFTIPAAAGLLAIGKPLIQILFQGGEFTAQSTELVYFALQFYLVALISQSMLDIVVRAFAAQQDTWTPLYVSFFTTAINIGLAIWLARPFAQGGIEHGGPALANGIAVLIEATTGLVILHFRWKGVDARRIIIDSAKALVAAAVMAGVLFLIKPLFGDSAIKAVALGSSIGMVVYLGVAYLLGIHEVLTIPLMILQRVRAGAQVATIPED